MTISENAKEKVEGIVAGTVMVLLLPAILVFGVGAWFVCEHLLDDDGRYTLFKRW
jgi:hypothetical protein